MKKGILMFILVIVCIGAYIMHSMVMYSTPTIKIDITEEEKELILENFNINSKVAGYISKTRFLPESYTIQIPFENISGIYSFLGRLNIDDEKINEIKEELTHYTSRRNYHSIDNGEVDAYTYYVNSECMIYIYDKESKYYFEMEKQNVNDSAVSEIFRSGEKSSKDVVVIDIIGITAFFVLLWNIIRFILRQRT